jgi:hypothetical protein
MYDQASQDMTPESEHSSVSKVVQSRTIINTDSLKAAGNQNHTPAYLCLPQEITFKPLCPDLSRLELPTTTAHLHPSEEEENKEYNSIPVEENRLQWQIRWKTPTLIIVSYVLGKISFSVLLIFANDFIQH